MTAVCAIGVLVALAACGGSSGGGTSTATGAEFKLGVVLPSSGVYAVLGESISNGMTLYFDKVGNQAGNRKIKVTKEDEANSPATAVAATRKLVEQANVDMLTGFVSTPDAYASRDYIDQNQVVTLVSNAGGNLLSRARKSKYIYRTSFSSWQVSQPLGKYVADKISKKVLVAVADYGFGNESAAAFKESFAAAGGTLVGPDVKAPLGTTDYGPFLAKIQSANPPALYTFFSGTDGVNFLKQASQVGLFSNIKLTSAGFSVEQDVLGALGDASPKGAISSLHWAATLDTKENRDFSNAYKAKFGKVPDVFAEQGWDTAHVIVDALNATKGNTTDKDKLLAAIGGDSFQSPRGSFKFDSNSQNVVNTIYIRQVYKDSKLGWTSKVIDQIPDVIDPGK